MNTPGSAYNKLFCINSFLRTGRSFCILFSLAFFLANTASASTHPIQITKNLILCEATIEGKQVLLVLDSGAPGLVLNSQYYTPNQPGEFTCSGVNGNFNCETRKIKNWDWLGIHFNSSEAMLTDLSLIEQTLHRKIDGLAGLSLLSSYYVSMDLDAHLIEVNEQPTEGVAFTKFQYSNHVPLINCRINGRMKKLGLDTGSENNYLFASKKELGTENIVNGTPIIVMGSENKKTSRSLLTMNLELESAQVNCDSGFIIDDNQEQSELLQLDGLLGQSFLSQFNITIHPGKKLISFTPRQDAVPSALASGN